MKQRGLCPLIESGNLTGCLTINEMKLMLYMCSNLGHEELENAVNTTLEKMN